MEVKHGDVVQDEKQNPNSSSASQLPAEEEEEEGEEEDDDFIRNYDKVLDAVLACNLFPPEFTDECIRESRVAVTQTSQLLEFQAQFKQTKKQHYQLQRHVFSIDEQARDLVTAIHWRSELLTQLYYRLMALRKSKNREPDPQWIVMKSGCTEEREKTDLKIADLISRAGIWPHRQRRANSHLEIKDPPYLYPVAMHIESGRCYYDYIKCKCKVRAYELLDSVEEIEKEHDLLRKKHGEVGDVSEHCILKQIEEVNKIPALVNGIEELLAGWRDFKKYHETVIEANHVIEKTAADLINIRMRSGIGEEGRTGEKCSVTDTLELLLQRVDLFEHRWESYDKFFTAYGDQPISKILPADRGKQDD